MSDHLPECSGTAGLIAPVPKGCICDRLRTCEQRVRHEGDVGPNRGGVHHELCGCDDDEPLCEPEDCPYCSCWRLRACEQRVLAEQLAGHEMAYDAGVQAARDAVKNAPWLTMCIGTEANPGVEEPWLRVTDALNAIDALRED